MIKNATFTSIWDGGYDVTTDCKVNTETKEAFDIEKVDIFDVENLDSEHITVDGEVYAVSTDKTYTEYWYSI